VLAVCLALVLLLSLRAGTRSTMDLVSGGATALVASVAARLAEHLEPARSQTAHVAALLGAAGAEPPDALPELLAASLAAAEQLAGTIFVTPAAKGVGVRRDPSGVLERFELTPDDPIGERLSVAAEAARRAHSRDGQWGNVVRGRLGGDAVVNYRQPVWHGDQFLGLLSAGVRTSSLARYLARIAAPSGAVAFVLLGTDEVVAASSLDMRSLTAAEGEALPRLAAIPDLALRDIWGPLDPALNEGIPSMAGFEVRVREVAGNQFVYVFQYVYQLGATPWIVGCYFEREQLVDAFSRLRIAAVAGGIVLSLAALATFLAGRALGRPVMRLARAAQAVRGGGLTAATVLPSSRLLEIDTASQAFNEMVEGLRERQLMRETFGRYVPESIADALIADHGVLRPQTRVCTTLFTDIVGFSAISERLSPEELIGALNEYFSLVVGPIESHGGVIHQFQGDAVLATYNLPVARDDHAQQAVRSALRIQATTRGRTFGPGVELATRVGVNTGLAVCGTVGSASRLGFTVHGDEVNLAARIEEMNKQLGTRILVAESTVALAGDTFAFSRVGELPVRGRRKPVVVYTVAGPHSADERS
jgi:class 3 adenylate cyclase